MPRFTLIVFVAADRLPVHVAPDVAALDDVDDRQPHRGRRGRGAARPDRDGGESHGKPDQYPAHGGIFAVRTGPPDTAKLRIRPAD